MYNQTVLYPIPLNDLETLIKNAVADAIKAEQKKELPQQLEDRTFSIAELAKYLDVTVGTIQVYKKRKIFPYYQTGRTVRFKKSEIDKAMAIKNR